MWKVIKYKLMDIMENRMIQILIVLFFLVLNISVLFSSYDLNHGGMEFNKTAKYLILMNKFTDISNILGLFISILIGSCFICDDIENGKIHILSISFPKRSAYYVGSFIAIFISMLIFIIMIIINYFIVAIIFKVTINYRDLYYCFTAIFINNIVITLITAIFSVIFRSTTGIIIGVSGVAIYNIYSFHKIPILDLYIKLDYKLNKVLSYLVPINSMNQVSVYNTGIERCEILVHPWYQVLYICMIVLIGAFIFKEKEI